MHGSNNHHRRPDQLPWDSWEAALPGVFKVNTNGAIFKEDNVFGVDIVIHDWRGRFVIEKSMKIAGSVEAYRVEIMAATKGLQLAIDLGIRALVLESDVWLVIECFGLDSNDMSHNGLILIELYRLTLGLNYFKVQYTLRC